MMGWMGFGGMVETKEEDCVVVLRCNEHMSMVLCMQGVMQQKRGEYGLYHHLGGWGESYIWGKTMRFPNRADIVM